MIENNKRSTKQFSLDYSNRPSRGSARGKLVKKMREEREFDEMEDRDLVPASLFGRLVAYIIDNVILVVASHFVARLLTPYVAKSVVNLPKGYTPEGVAEAIVYILLWIVIYLAPLVIRGQSLGKILFGIRVEHVDGGLLGGFRMVVVREIIGKFISLTLIIGPLFGLFNRRKRCLHDFISGSAVYKV